MLCAEHAPACLYKLEEERFGLRLPAQGTVYKGPGIQADQRVRMILAEHATPHLHRLQEARLCLCELPLIPI
jgi:hypothetical protein